jgi:hypothetical protein
MNDARVTIAEDRPGRSAHRWLWALAWFALLAWQFWLTLGLFGPEPLARIMDDSPIMNGSHPQHLYLGALGARGFVERGQATVFDKRFQAGYLKTPIFDGSRVAEVFLVLGGGSYRPAAYKIGLFSMCLLVPVLLIVACRAAGLSRPGALLATALGQLVWWGPLGRGALAAGDSEILLASLAGLTHVGCLVAFHRRPGLPTWLGLLITACLGWFLQPLLFPIALPLLLAYYLSVGVKHDFMTWHVAFWLAQQGAVLVNLPWLLDWVSYWWLRSPLPSAANTVLAHRTLANVWNAPLWGGPADRLLTVVVMSSALGGIVILNQTRQRPAARLLGMGAAGALTLALLGISWEPLGQVGTAALLAPALWFASLPAAHFWVRVSCKLWALGKPGRTGLAVLGGLALLGLAAVSDTTACISGRCVHAQPLTFGLNSERQELVDRLLRYTTPSNRILWEDRAVSRQDSRWAALLPRLTDRSFIGGLDPDGFIEPSSICLSGGSLENRPIASWRDEELDSYCRRYSIGWIVAWSPTAIGRFSEWSGVEKVVQVSDGAEGCLFRVKQPGGIALRGRAELVEADDRYTTLKDVEPENGVVVISLHYQAGMRATPGRVQIEREPSGDDPIGFVRLRLAEPAARVTITWQR